MLEFVNCKHCTETGTCSNGENKTRCARCRAHWVQSLPTNKPAQTETGIVCSVCWGKGVTEPTSSKWQNRFTPALAIGFVSLAFILVFVVALFRAEHLDQVLVFAGT